jgi:hypothetical protein
MLISEMLAIIRCISILIFFSESFFLLVHCSRRQGGDIKPKNKWIEHFKQFAKDNGVGYFKALSDLKCKSTYKKIQKLVH